MNGDPTSQLAAPEAPDAGLTPHQYRLLSEFRYLIRCFLAFSEEAAAQAGLTPRQHQALLTIKGAAEGTVASVGYLADRLHIQHHSAVELVDRLAEAGLVVRKPDPDDRRRIRLRLTRSAQRLLEQLSASHLLELRRMRPALLDILDTVDPGA